MTEGVFSDILKQQESYYYTNLVKRQILISIDPYQLSPFSLKSLKKLYTITSQSLWRKII